MHIDQQNALPLAGPHVSVHKGPDTFLTHLKKYHGTQHEDAEDELATLEQEQWDKAISNLQDAGSQPHPQATQGEHLRCDRSSCQ